MRLRTHIAIGCVVAFYFLPHINQKTIFVPVVIISSILPNLISITLPRGKNNEHANKKSFFSKEGSRDLLHTFTLCIAVTIALSFFYPLLALPFFLGYSFHLYADAFTPEGITPFWPYKKKSKGKVKNGGVIDDTIFYICTVFAIALFIASLFT